jgi:hypothetical protein
VSEKCFFVIVFSFNQNLFFFITFTPRLSAAAAAAPVVAETPTTLQGRVV